MTADQIQDKQSIVNVGFVGFVRCLPIYRENNTHEARYHCLQRLLFAFAGLLSRAGAFILAQTLRVG